MKLAIADPPYLGRARRWYGAGRANGGGHGRADVHEDAAAWDLPATHVALAQRLVDDFDGFAIAAAPSSLGVYLTALPADVRVMVWRRRNAVPSGSRIRGTWEAVIVRVPPTRRGRAGTRLDDYLDAPAPRRGFAGSKPAAWTQWVLDALGFDPLQDELADLFRGSGAVLNAASVLPTPR